MTNQNIFRAYDIRGIYGKDITEETAEFLGKAFGTFLGEGKKVVVARDVRDSGESLKENLINGLISTGCDVVDIGIVTTPMMYFYVTKHGFDAGVEVTASHNPAEWNGFKMTKERGILCSEGFGMEEIKDIFLKKQFKDSTKVGKVTKTDIFEDYKNFILPKIKISKKLKVVIDPGNGAASNIADKLFREVGHDVIVINGEPDGSFPSRASDPIEENVGKLKEEVVKNKADIGVAFDGDADRLAFVDNLGRYVWSGNITIPIFSEYYLKNNNNAKIVFDICCSSYVEEMIKKNKGIPVANKVGHSFIMNRMIKEKAIFGGEYSNHLYFSEIFGFDDAMFAALKMSEILTNRNEKFSDIIDKIPKYPTSKVLEIQCRDDKKFKVVSIIGDKLKKEGYNVLNIDGAKAFDKENNWMLIRASNTLPVIKINSEAKSEEKMKNLFNYAKNMVEIEIASN